MDIKDCQIAILNKKKMFFEKQNEKIIIKDILDYTYKKGILKNVYLSKNNEDLISLNNFELDTINIIKRLSLKAIPEKIYVKDKITNNYTIYSFNIKNFNDNYFKITKKNINLKEEDFKWIQQYPTDIFEDVYIQKKLDTYKKEGKNFSYFKFNNSFIVISDYLI
jgi:hypothetical protein